MDSDYSRPCILLEEAQSALAKHLTAETGARALLMAETPAMAAVMREDLPADGGVAGRIFAGAFLIEPYGETPPEHAVEDARRQALDFARAGADCLLIYGARSLIQARTAVIGAKEAGLPVLAAFELVGEGDHLRGGGDILAAFITLQELGIAAFGFSADVAGVMFGALERVRPYSRIPLLAMTRNLAGALRREDAMELFRGRARKLARQGVSMMRVAGGREGDLLATAGAMCGTLPDPVERVDYRAADEIWLTNETQVYYLDTNLEYSDPLICESDMADAVLEAEREGRDVVCIELTSAADGEFISRNNAALSRMAAAFFSEDREALAAALRAYNGRALVDGRSGLEPEELAAAAAPYGAVVL